MHTSVNPRKLKIGLGMPKASNKLQKKLKLGRG